MVRSVFRKELSVELGTNTDCFLWPKPEIRQIRIKCTLWAPAECSCFFFFSHLKTVGKKRSNTRKRKLDENLLHKKKKKKRGLPRGCWKSCIITLEPLHNLISSISGTDLVLGEWYKLATICSIKILSSPDGFHRQYTWPNTRLKKMPLSFSDWT